MEEAYDIYFDKLNDIVKLISFDESSKNISIEEKEALLNYYKNKAEDFINYINLELDIENYSIF